MDKDPGATCEDVKIRPPDDTSAVDFRLSIWEFPQILPAFYTQLVGLSFSRRAKGPGCPLGLTVNMLARF